MTYQEQLKRIKIMPWKNNEFLIELDGYPIGTTLSYEAVTYIARWLPSALLEIGAAQSVFEKKPKR